MRNFIAEHDPFAAARVGKRLGRAIRLLRDQHALKRPSEDIAGVRELVASGYVVRHSLRDEAIVVLQIWRGPEFRRGVPPEP